MSISDYVEVLRRRVVLFLFVLIVTAAGYVIVALRDDDVIFSASGQVSINAPDPVASLTDLEFEERKRATEVQVFERDDVRASAEDALGHAVEQPRISVQAVDEIDGLRVSAQSREPQEAVKIVAAFLDAYVAFSLEQRSRWFLESEPALLLEIEGLQDRIDELSARLEGDSSQDPASIGGSGANSTLSAQLVQLGVEQREKADQLERIRLAASSTNGGVEIVNEPKPLDTPAGPQPLRSLAVGILVGLFLGVGAAFLREYLDKTIWSPKQIARGVPGLSVISTVDVESQQLTGSVVLERPHSEVVEDYRRLRSITQSLAISKGKRVIQIVASTPGEGTSATAANIALLLTQVGTRVLLIDADVQFPKQHRIFGLEAGGGLAQVLAGEPLTKNLSPIEANLDLLSFAESASSESDLLSGPAMERLLEEARSLYDVVIIDSPPLSQSSDSYGLSVFVDVVVLVVGLNMVTMPQLQESFTALRSLDRGILGAVVIDRGASRKWKVGASL